MCDRNTSADSVQTAMDDVLEITAVYGTQKTKIKKENEFKGEDSAPDDRSEEILNNPLVSQCVTKRSLVYTTRLDQMNAFNEIEKYSPKEATEMIFKESKPRYEQMFLKIKLEAMSHPDIHSYIKLCSQIKQLNTKVKTETYLRNQKLLKICKPLRIILKDFKLNKRKSQSVNYPDMQCMDNSTKEYEPSLCSSNDKSLSKTSHCRKNNQAATITVAVKDIKSQEADIYIMDAEKCVKSYYRTNMNECSTLGKLHCSKQPILLEYCCWVDREKRLKKLIQLIRYYKESLYFLKKPHNCLPRPCSCCCAPGTPMLSKIKLSKLNTKSVDTNDVTDTVSRNNIIDKAKNYKANSPLTMHLTTDNKQLDYLNSAVIIIKYHRTMFAQTASLGEIYEIGSNGELVKFTRPTVDRSITETIAVDQKCATSNISKIYYSYLVCCWENREDIIRRLYDDCKLSPSVMKFIRTPHPCPNNTCECCCKPRPSISLINNIPISTSTRRKRKMDPVGQSITSAMKQTKQTVPKRRIVNRNPGIEKELDTENAELTNINNNHNSISKPNNRVPNNLPNNLSPKQDITNPALNACSEHNEVPKHSPTLNTKNVQFPPTADGIINNTRKDTSIITAAIPTVKDILNRFNGLQLAVNEKGKLTAVLKVTKKIGENPKLSTEDVKMLSDFLLKTSSQIAQVGITPQEFCAHFNSSRNMNNNVQMPILIPINAPLNNPQISKEFENECKMTTNADQCIPRKEPNSCKVVPPPPNSSVPTKNTRPNCSIYKVMSSLGGEKNQHLMKAYKSHFREDIPKNQSKRILQQMLKSR